MFHNRIGTDIEQRIESIDKELGIGNIKDIPIETVFPDSGPESSSIHFVESGGLWLVLLTKGTRYRVQLNTF